MSRTNFSFYKNTSIESAARILTEGTIFYNNPMNFNDPFDCNPIYTSEQLVQDIQVAFNRFGRMDVSPEYAKRNIESMPELQNGLLREMACRNLGVTCFSLNPFNPPMWYHYASQHMGLVIEFTPTDDLPFESQSNDKHKKIHPVRVSYYEEGSIPKIDGKVQAYDILFHKTKHWEYEEEVRDVTTKSGVFEFDRIQIGKVYGGIQIAKEDRDKIANIISKMNNETGGKAEYIQMDIDYNTSRMILK